VPSLIHLGGKEGMQTLDQALAGLVKRGLVARSTAMERSSNPGLLLELLGGFASTDGRRETKVGTSAGQ
jgi:twitching motility protein PilT